MKLKVKTQVQDDQVRVTAKSRDEQLRLLLVSHHGFSL
jgi:uncharacterized protein YajQ (UPF0234 family)